MSQLLQVCVVVLTLAGVLLIVALVRLLRRLTALADTAETVLHHADLTFEQSSIAWERVRGLLDSAEDIAQTARAATRGVAHSAGRVASLASLVIEDLERPVRTAVAFVHGVRTAADALARRRRDGSRFATDSFQGEHHVGQQHS